MMMMIYTKATKLLPKPFDLGSRLGNAGNALGNIGKTMLQDSATLKTDIAFWATLLHTVMRVQEAYITGEVEPYDEKHTQMTSEERTYRRDQSAMTYFRELVGVTLGWGVLKVGQAYQKSAMQKEHNYHNGSKYSVSVKQGLGQLWDALAQDKDVVPLPNVFTDTPTEIYKKHTTIDAASQQFEHERLDLDKGHAMQKVDAQLVKWGHMLRDLKPGEKATHLWDDGFIRRVKEFFVPDKEAEKYAKMAISAIDNGLLDNKELVRLEERGFKFAQKFIPTVVWSIPGILFAGVWLERTTLYKGPSVQKWTVSALETLGIIDSSQDDNEALVEASKVATIVKAEPEKLNPLPSFPYYYADAVGASLMYHQELYGKPKPVTAENPPRLFSVLSTSDTEKIVLNPTASPTLLNPSSVQQLKPAIFSSTNKPMSGVYNTLINRSGFAL